MRFLPYLKNKHSSRKQMMIKEIMDGILVLPNHNYQTILECSALNFELKSEDEQDTILDSFQNFLNSLSCPIQIVIRIRQISVEQYLQSIQSRNLTETNEIYKQQLTNYQSFIQSLVLDNRILSRHFYVVIPYYNAERDISFGEIKERMLLNRDLLIKGLERIGLSVKQLDTFEALNIFYQFYNSNQAISQKLDKNSLPNYLSQSL